MMKPLAAAVLLLAACMLTAQPARLDSLRRGYAAESVPQKKAELYYAIARQLMDQDPELGVRAADTLEQLANAAAHARSLHRAGFLRGAYYESQGQLDEAMRQYRMALEGFAVAGYPDGIAMACNSVAGVFRLRYELDSAIRYYLMALDLHARQGNESEAAAAYSNIGTLYSGQQMYDEAIRHLKKALEIRLRLNEPRRLMFTYNNLAVAYGGKEVTDTAMHYSQLGIEIAEQQGNAYVAGVLMNGVSNLLIKDGRYEESIRWADRSIASLQSANRKVNLVFPYVNKADALSRLNRHAEALRVAEAGYRIMQETGQANPLQVYYEVFARANEGLGRYREANEWWKQFRVLDDSLFKEENARSMAELEAKYQNQKHETALAQQQLQLAEQTNRILQQRAWIFGLAGSMLLLSAVAYLLYHRNQLRHQARLREAVIREQQLGLNAVIEAQEQERRRIAKDLHDGIAQELAALNMGMQVMQYQAQADSPAVAERIRELAGQLASTSNEVRTIAHVMLPPALEQQGLPGSLEALLRSSLISNGIDARLECSGLPPRLDQKVELGLYRIVQELVNNILKHARAASVEVNLLLLDNVLTLKVQDDGQGFDFEQVRKQGSMGLLNILSRTAALGGVFTSEPARPSGTVSIIRVPVDA